MISPITTKKTKIRIFFWCGFGFVLPPYRASASLIFLDPLHLEINGDRTWKQTETDIPSSIPSTFLRTHAPLLLTSPTERCPPPRLASPASAVRRSRLARRASPRLASPASAVRHSRPASRPALARTRSGLGSSAGPWLGRGLVLAALPCCGRAPTLITAGAMDATAVRGQARRGLCSGRRRRAHGCGAAAGSASRCARSEEWQHPHMSSIGVQI